MALPESKQPVVARWPPYMPCPQNGTAQCSSAPRRTQHCPLTVSSTGWAVLARCCASRDKKCKPMQWHCSASMNNSEVLPERSLQIIFGPISRHRITQVLVAVRKASRATRPGLIAGAIRVLCNGVCTSHRFCTENDDRDHFW